MLTTGKSDVPELRTFHDFIAWADAYIKRSVGRSVPGVSAAFTPSGETTVLTVYGHADNRCRVPITADSIFQAASISKSVTAYSVAVLVDRGLVCLDDPVERHVTRWSLPQSEWESDEVTVRRVLCHRAGLSLGGYRGFLPDQQLPSLEESLSGLTGRSYGDGRPDDVRIVFQPGSRLEYSGGGYTLLQLLIEEVSGVAFSRFAGREVLDRLDMHSSSFEHFGPAPHRLAVGHRDIRTFPNYLFTARAAAGLYTSASDLAKFLTDLYNGYAGRPGMLNSDRYQEFAAITDSLSTSSHVGMGFFIDDLPDGSELISHSGGNIGWNCYFGVNLANGEGIAILTNSDDGYTEIVNPILTAYRRYRVKNR
jgi:CubicO group peptidase (beta-lactamase class C family)